MPRIGFIGLGAMGKPMAKNLIKAGHELVVFSRSPGPCQELEKEGAKVARSAAEVAANVDLVITMLPDSPDVEKVVTGPDGVLESAHDGLIYVDMSSIAPAMAQKVAAACAEKGVPMLDAPVSGGEPRAIDGSLAIMVGGPKDVFDKVEPILLDMGSGAVHVGDVGSGNITKLANQVIVAVNIAAVSEALTLAKKAGADPARVLDAISGGFAGSEVLKTKGPQILDRNFAPGFRIELHDKDLKNALETGENIDSPLPLTSIVKSIMVDLMQQGHNADDHCVLVKHYENASHVLVKSDA
ncbi:2-hydroxy-3-oxopropionate reductase [Mariluticola halotolerans]|uniref:2-hydroxy-3-oxopropionate reductase n=1 Tax=Mariluticola halotolerans TaxID=2909283 RepID=UPI0026E44003|nr:2-hydroxy-3-oxopropionate reductase [Mariluticola halotolerans]UJQ94822.1 2-hydroxy-3-oxopropionate reductase [Mariluticola halotolerans]